MAHLRNALVALVSLQAGNFTINPTPARFGPALTEPLSGKLSPIFLHDPNGTPQNLGCPFHSSYDFGFTRKTTEDLIKPAENWIALIQRGSCDFSQKCLVAQELGAKACIIGNDQQDVNRYGDVNLILGSSRNGDDSALDIPSFGISGKQYSTLVKAMEKDGPLSVGAEFAGLDVEIRAPEPEPTFDDEVKGLFMESGPHHHHHHDESSGFFGKFFIFFTFFMVAANAMRIRRARSEDSPEPEVREVRGVAVNRYDQASQMEEAGIEAEAPPSYSKYVEEEHKTQDPAH